MRTLVLLTLPLLFPALALCQQVTGNIEGRVLDDQGSPVAYVNISVTGPNLLGTRGTVSTSDGDFRVLALPVGVYACQERIACYMTRTPPRLER